MASSSDATAAPVAISAIRQEQLNSNASGEAASRCSPTSTSYQASASEAPSLSYLLTHRPLAALHLLPRDGVLFAAGAVAGALGKTITAPLDRVKILMQVKGGLQEGAMRQAAASGNLVNSFMAIGKQEGIVGYWKGNLPQVLRILPYSAVQLLSYEAFKKAFTGKDGNLSVPGRLCAGACAGMASTLATYPLDTLRLRLAVDPKMRSIGGAMTVLLSEGGPAALFRGLAPAMIGIAPYMAIELASYDLLPPTFPPFARGFAAALLATSVCYPLDTLRRQIQMHSSSGISMGRALSSAVEAEGWGGLYRGFLPNALKNMPNKGIRLSTFDTAKRLLAEGDTAFVEEQQHMAGGMPRQAPADRQLPGSCLLPARPLIALEVVPLQI